MTSDFSSAFHIVPGPSAAGSVKQAHHFSSDKFLIGYDPLASGPIPLTTDLEQWKSVRDEYWAGINVEYAYVINEENDLFQNIDRLREDRSVVLWVASSVSEQLLAASVAYLYTELGLDLSNLSIVQVHILNPKDNIFIRVRHIAELSPEKVQSELQPPGPWTEDELHEYRRAWLTYTSDDTAVLQEYLANLPDNEVLAKAMQRLVYRYPSDVTGLCAVDEEMLRQTKLQGPRAARIIGHSMGELMDTEEYLGDGVMFHRLVQMSCNERSSPLVTIEGDPTKMRECEVALTEFGERVLAGEANVLEVDPADDWIGGVHLNGLWPVPHRKENELVMPV
ncbi:MAG: DUF1835 domain-containing protein [Gammaproteobacteria bacterium]